MNIKPCHISRTWNIMWILKKKYDYWWKKYGLEKTDRATKTSLFDRNWATSLKPRWRSRPLRLVWWASYSIVFDDWYSWMSSIFYKGSKQNVTLVHHLLLWMSSIFYKGSKQNVTLVHHLLLLLFLQYWGNNQRWTMPSNTCINNMI